ncbi:hypothetical protein DPMN_115982 [Dreissena polymorpha]|uniref:Uncharacterized protein n=1 Tax=Dreissena polymorpha TaxID=45954 RepID=A0A9D4KNW9_DREPO|nr:hypothetical protein DPMN_115982 [Dreissena polymorpha]
MNKQEGLKGPKSKNAPPPGSHVFQPIVTIFQLIQDIIETYILAKFYEDWNINVESSILELSSGNHLVDGHTDRHEGWSEEGCIGVYSVRVWWSFYSVRVWWSFYSVRVWWSFGTGDGLGG